MNTRRVQPEQFGEEPTDFTEFTSASSEDEEPVSLSTWALVILAIFLSIAVLAGSAGYWLNLY